MPHIYFYPAIFQVEAQGDSVSISDIPPLYDTGRYAERGVSVCYAQIPSFSIH